MSSWARMYRTPLWLTCAFVALLALFAAFPTPTTAESELVEPASEPTPAPRECVVCPIDQRCDPGTGRCVFIERTPLPCVRGATYDEEAGFCLPDGPPPPPPAPAAPRRAVVEEAPDETQQQQQPPSISRDRQRAPRMPGMPDEWR